MRHLLWCSVLAASLALAGCGDDEDPPTGGDDVEPPTISLTAPADSARIVQSRSLDFSATANDNIGVRLVVFYFDGEAVAQDVVGESRVFTAHWDTEPLPVGSHLAVAEAIDWANLRARDSSVVIILATPASPEAR